LYVLLFQDVGKKQKFIALTVTASGGDTNWMSGP
jgi:hypothetical protein